MSKTNENDLNRLLSMDWEEVMNNNGLQPTGQNDPVSISDALIRSIAECGKVNLHYIARKSGACIAEVIETLKGSIYQDPEIWEQDPYKGWETAEEYLSGNLHRKLTAARDADQKYHCFGDNIKALSDLLPDFLKADSIYVTLGSPWVPTWVIDSFIEHLFEKDSCRHPFRFSGFQVKHNDYGWEIPHKSRYGHSVLVSHTYGTRRLEALHILEMTLNMRTAAVYDEVPSDYNSSGIKRVLNEGETLLAVEKQKLLIEEFRDWVWKNKYRQKELTELFESRYACNRQRMFDGSYLTFPGMSPAEQLYPYQKNAVSRIILTGNTLLAHEVGCGKTFVMIAAGMELKRLRMSSRNLYVVPNNIVAQWKELFERLYPNARILVLDPGNFGKAARNKMLRKVRDEDFDAVIIAYSCFDLIPVSKAYYMNELEERIKTLEKLMENPHEATTAAKAKLKNMKTALAKLAVSPKDGSDKVFFDELGITRLFVDEAHNYKNVPVDTRTYGISGIRTTGSKKCQHMMDAVRIVQKNNNGGVVMATGTPITNSLSDIYIMQQYLQSGELAVLDLQTFDSWIGMFAERNTELEIDVDTSSYRMATRFSRFHNLPELTALIASFTDFHMVDDHAEIPETEGYEDALLPKSAELAAYLKEISHRTDSIHKGNVRRTEDNLLKVTTDGRKAALDIRLVMPQISLPGPTKVSKCSMNIAQIYQDTLDFRGTQLVFCDISTPREGFNMYDELKKQLVLRGIPEEEIAYIHDADTEAKRQALYRKMCSGTIRVLIGSTFKLGLGVNIQERLAALHHLDVPWRPADMTQREGRILRQGNRNKKVRLFRYVTDGSFDAYSWQLLEIKQRFISDLLSGALGWRYADDIDSTILSYAEIKALVVGNPIIKRRCEAVNELRRFQSLQRKLIHSKEALETKLMYLSELFTRDFQDAGNNLEDLNRYREWMKAHPAPTTKKEKAMESARRQKFSKTLRKALRGNVMRKRERQFMEPFKGFDVILPAGMTEEEPFVWLEGTLRHKVHVTAEDPDILSHLDSVLGSLSRSVEKKQQDLLASEAELGRIKDELEKEETYAGQILKLKEEIELIDEQLEVNKNE